MRYTNPGLLSFTLLYLADFQILGIVNWATQA